LQKLFYFAKKYYFSIFENNAIANVRETGENPVRLRRCKSYFGFTLASTQAATVQTEWEGKAQGFDAQVRRPICNTH